MHIFTPWGMSQTEERIADGITKYSTASHGGIHVTPEKLKEAPEHLTRIDPFCQPGWYEEDEDWALPVLMFPLYFSPRQCWYAVRTVIAHHSRLFHLVDWATWRRTDSGRAVEERAKEYERAEGFPHNKCEKVTV